MSKHDQIAERLAKKFHTEYKSQKGIDLVLSNKVIEVEVFKSTLDDGVGQVVHSSKARYLAVPKRSEKAALEKTKGTGIGVMTEYGNIVKKATRS